MIGDTGRRHRDLEGGVSANLARARSRSPLEREGDGDDGVTVRKQGQ